MSNKLTSKQALFAKHYASGKSGKQAAVLAGYSERSSEVIASENLTKPNVLAKIESILDKAGLSDEALAQRLQQAIDAGLGEKAKNADSLKGIRMALELKDRFPSKKHEITQESTYEMRLMSMTTEELEDYLVEITVKTQEYLQRIADRRKQDGVGNGDDSIETEQEVDDSVQVPRAVGKVVNGNISLGLRPG